MLMVRTGHGDRKVDVVVSNVAKHRSLHMPARMEEGFRTGIPENRPFFKLQLRKTALSGCATAKHCYAPQRHEGHEGKQLVMDLVKIGLLPTEDGLCQTDRVAVL